MNAWMLMLAALAGQESWSGELHVDGALRAIMHDGKSGAAVTLDARLPDPDLYGVGALADLAGEVTIVAGRAYLSRPDEEGGERTVEAETFDVGATLLVTAEVAGWRELTVERELSLDELGAEVVRLAEAAGIDSRRFPFLLEGTFDELQWHVIDGRRLPEGGGSHADHREAAVVRRATGVSATLVGFYSESDGGVFTHMGATTHVHSVLADGSSAGHVDALRVPAGAVLRLPK